MVTGGIVDLGTALKSGGNLLKVAGPGDAIRNLTSNRLSAIGNTFQVNGSTLTSGFQTEDEIYHSLDAAGLGLVTYDHQSVFVTPASGSIQRGVDAVDFGGAVRVQGTNYSDYTVGSKHLTVEFTTGHRFVQQFDPLGAGARSLCVTGTAAAEHIHLSPGPGTGAVNASLSEVPTGTFAPDGRIVVFAGNGDDNVQIAGSIALPVWLFGEGGDDRLKGGAGHNVLLGGDGEDLLVGGSGRDFLIGGQGADRIVGNSQDDILIAGITTFDNNEAALSAIMAEWTSLRDYSTRTANISGTGGGSSFAAPECQLLFDHARIAKHRDRRRGKRRADRLVRARLVLRQPRQRCARQGHRFECARVSAGPRVYSFLDRISHA